MCIVHTIHLQVDYDTHLENLDYFDDIAPFADSGLNAQALIKKS